MKYLFQHTWWKYFLLFLALMIGIFSLWYTNNLVLKLSEEEKRKVELWADANRLFNIVDDESQAFNFIFQVIQENETVPVILVDDEGNVQTSRNLDPDREDDPDYLDEQLEIMRSQHEPIMIEYGANRNFIYYKESNLIRQLRIFPYVQLFIISVFLLIAYMAFNASRKYEQNRVWVGMAKETAHQLGTPLSSLMAWVDYLEAHKENKLDDSVVIELRKDIERLLLVTNRFSKIGSSPVLTKLNLYDIIDESIGYLKTRVSNKVTISISENSDKNLQAYVSPPLFGWVIENLTKNAIDAMEGGGTVTFYLHSGRKSTYIDVIDTGKGISSKYFKQIFEPGYTTRRRGWGLGLSLAQRIISFYHKGSLYVQASEPGKGTTMRIKLPN